LSVARATAPRRQSSSFLGPARIGAGSPERSLLRSSSPAFKLREARSVEAERVIEDAEAFMRGDEPVLYKTRAAIDTELHRVLTGDDVFWPP